MMIMHLSNHHQRAVYAYFSRHVQFTRVTKSNLFLNRKKKKKKKKNHFSQKMSSMLLFRRLPVATASRFTLTGAMAAAYSTKTIFVGNLAWSVRTDDLGNLFSQYGEVKSARVLTDRETGRSRGFGFVELDEAAANEALTKLNGYNFKGREIRVSVC
jgi:hypothetical protein